MIEQQLYTKAEKGLTKNTLGMDTVAKSQGLEKAYLTNHIHQYCSYGIFDNDFFSNENLLKIRTFISLINDDMVVGQSVLGKSDAIVHNFIIKKSVPEWSYFVKDIRNLVCADGFVEQYDKANGINLPQLEGIDHHEKKLNLENCKAFFSQNSITEQSFRTLLAAVFYVFEKRKKIFISLKGSIIEEQRAAGELIKFVFAALPYAVRQKLGYTNFFYAGEAIAGIEVYFVYNKLMPESGNIIKLGERNTAKDYIFDFEHQNFLHHEFEQTQKSEFLNLVIENLKSLEKMNGFYEFAQAMSCKLPDVRRLGIRLYDDLVILYNIERQSDEEFIASAGKMVIALGDILNSGNETAVFLDTYKLFLSRYLKTLTASGSPASMEITKRLVYQYDGSNIKIKEDIESLILCNLELCLQEGNNELMFTHMEIVKASNALYREIVQQKLVSRPELLNIYIKYLFDQKKTVHAIMELTDYMLGDMAVVIEKPNIKNMLYNKAVELYESSGDRFIALRYLEDKCRILKDKYPDKADLFEAIHKDCLDQFMRTVTISSLSVDHIMEYSLTGVEKMGDEAKLKQNMILALKEILLLTQDPTMAFIHYDAFGFENIEMQLSSDLATSRKAEAEIKKRLWTAANERKIASKRAVYPVVLYAAENKENALSYDFDRIFKFISDTLDTEPSDFINWFMNSSLYIMPEKHDDEKTLKRNVAGMEEADASILSAFYNSVLNYYHKKGGAFLRNKRYVQKLKKSLCMSKGKHKDYDAVLDDFNEKFNSIVYQQLAPIDRFFSWVGKGNIVKVIIIAIIVLAIVLLGVLIAKQYAQDAGASIPAASDSSDESKTVLMENVKRSRWSASIISNEGESISAPRIIDNTTFQKFNLEKDDAILVSIGDITVDGISIVFSEDTDDLADKLKVKIETVDNKKITLSQSDYEDGATIYTFKKATTVKNIIIENNAKDNVGVVEIKNINAFIIKLS